MLTEDLSAFIPFQVTPWLTSLGYSLCYGTIVVKMARVWYIYNNPAIQKKYVSITEYSHSNLVTVSEFPSSWQEFHDWHLALAVLLLAVIDVSILGLYMLVDGVRGQLGATRIVNRENPEDMIGVSEFQERLSSEV